MDFLVFNDSIRKKHLDSFVSFLRKRKSFGCYIAKVFPKEEDSKTISYIRNKISSAYQFVSIRGLVVLKAKPLFSIEELTHAILGEGHINDALLVYRRKLNWYESWIEGVPFLVFHRIRNGWEIYLPGAPTKPFSETGKHVLTPFLMSWPNYVDSLLLKKDFPMSIVVDNMKSFLKNRHLDMNENYVDCIQHFVYKSTLNNLNSALDLYFSDCDVFPSECYSFRFSKNKTIFIDSDRALGLKHSDKTVSNISFKKRDLFRLIYDTRVSNIKHIEGCHRFAEFLKSRLSFIEGMTSYCQRAFEDCTDFDENTDISYGHDTFKEKQVLPISSVFLYWKGNIIKIFIYQKKLIAVSLNEYDKAVFDNGMVLHGWQLMYVINSLILEYLNEEICNRTKST